MLQRLLIELARIKTDIIPPNIIFIAPIKRTYRKRI